jgi:hypothetical protein
MGDALVQKLIPPALKVPNAKILTVLTTQKASFSSSPIRPLLHLH